MEIQTTHRKDENILKKETAEKLGIHIAFRETEHIPSNKDSPGTLLNRYGSRRITLIPKWSCRQQTLKRKIPSQNWKKLKEPTSK